MIRFSLLYLFTLAMVVYAWKDWFITLCGLILITAVLERPDMPHAMFGIEGLNLWNVLFLVLLPAWMVGRRREGFAWDMPRHLSFLLILYLAVVLLAFVRLITGPGIPLMGGGPEARMSAGDLVREYLVNPLKFAIPGLLLFDGARTRRRFLYGIASLLGMYFTFALLIIKWVPLSMAASGAELDFRTGHRLFKVVGHHRTTLSVMLAGASWAMVAAASLARSTWLRLGVLAAAGVTVLGQALTAGRAGYVAWAAVGLLLSLLRWRRYLLLAPVAVLAIVMVAPAVVERSQEGLATGEEMDEEAVDQDTFTAGRSVVWPYMLAKIAESPFLGHGRIGFVMSGLRLEIALETRAWFGHPHNAYLEWLLDNGWVGMFVVLPFYGLLLVYSTILLRDSRSPIFVAGGGVGFALVLALLVGGLTGQSFYPRESTVGVWCGIGLMLRAWVERSRIGKGIVRSPVTGARAPLSPHVASGRHPGDAAGPRRV